MGLADWLPWSSKAKPEAALAASLPIPTGDVSETAPDMAEFRRQAWSLGDLSSSSLLSLAALGSEVGPHTRPQDVPWEVLDAMGYDPVIYLGERAVQSVALDPELYYVRHDDQAVVARTETWLRPILRELLEAILPAFAYGCAPFVLDWRVDDLETRTEAGRLKTYRAHLHYGRVSPIWPGDAMIRAMPTGDLAALIYGATAYEGRDEDSQGRPLARRAFVPVWGRQFGRWEGSASRRRAYKAWYQSAVVELWQARYLERSVDVPRIGFAPNGMINVNGEDVSALRVLTAAMMSLKGGSACALPSETDGEGRPLWRIEPLQLPDRHGVWSEALSWRDAKKLEACLMPPGIASGSDVLSSAKVADSLMREFVQALADFAACTLSEVVRAVHLHEGGRRLSAPQVIANDVPQARRKILLEILKATINSTQHLPDGRTYTLGELVHPELLEQLGVTARSVEEAAHSQSNPTSGQPGRPRDTTSDREERREDARTDEGEDATGDDDESVE